MTNDLRGTSADTMSAVPDALVSAEARVSFPTASVLERGYHAGEDMDATEKCVGGSRVAGPAVGSSLATSSGIVGNSAGKMAWRAIRWTAAMRSAVVAAYIAGGPLAALKVGASYGASKSATYSVVDKYREAHGLPTWAQERRAALVDFLAEAGTATTQQLAAMSGFSPAGVRNIARSLGWVETKVRRGSHPGKCEQSWRLPS